MADKEFHFQGNRDDLRRRLAELIGSLAHGGGELGPLARGIKLRVGVVALDSIQQAFLAKAKGGVGDDGIRWKPLKKQTIANRRLGPGDRGLMAGYGAHNGRDALGRPKRGFLTPDQDKRWRMLFATRLNWLMAKHGLNHGEASARAAQIAWATLKAEGAKTKLEVLGNRQVEIGRDTGRLFDSLSPGVANPDAMPLLQEPAEVEDRILREAPGAVIVGSNVEYAGKFHAERPLWPAGELPAAWAERIAENAQSGIAEAISMVLGSGAGRGRQAA